MGRKKAGKVQKHKYCAYCARGEGRMKISVVPGYVEPGNGRSKSDDEGHPAHQLDPWLLKGPG